MILNLADWSHGKPPAITYSGDSISKQITVDGIKYTLYTLTGSGTLTVDKSCPADLWICGGGGLGSAVYRGGGGGYFAQKDRRWLHASTAYTVTVGGAQGTTTFAQSKTTIATAAGSTSQNGASGGGGGATGNGAYATAGTGGGVSTRPFGDAVNFTNLPCAGGGGVGDIQYSDSTETAWGYGGAGGSNGSNGSNAIRSTSSQKDCNGGAGGETGGGRGAHGRKEYYAANGSYYGAGAGGGWADAAKNRASGYQGVVFMRVPVAAKFLYQYYRINMSAMKRASTSGTFFSVAELQLFKGDNAVSTAGATLSASSSLSGYPVAQAFDGDTSTLWHVDGSPSSAWIQVQLPAAAAITSFSITPRGDQNDRLDAFTLDASNDGNTWTTLYSASSQAAGWPQGATKTFTI